MRNGFVFLAISILLMHASSLSYAHTEHSSEIEAMILTPANGLEFFLLNLEVGLNRNAEKARMILPGFKDIRATYVVEKKKFIFTIFTLEADKEPDKIPHDTLDLMKREISSLLRVSSIYNSRISPRPKSSPSLHLRNLSGNILLVIKQAWKIPGGSKLRVYRSILNETDWDIRDLDVDRDG